MSNRAKEFLTELNSAGIKYEIDNGYFKIVEPMKLSTNQLIRFGKLNNRELTKAAGELK